MQREDANERFAFSRHRVAGIATVGALPTSMMVALYVIGAVALVTGTIGFCPAWMLLGINTCGVKRET